MNTGLKLRVNRAMFKLKAASPKIMVIGGAIGVVGTVVLASKATLKADKIVRKAKEDIKKCHDLAEDEDVTEYTEEDEKNDIRIITIQTGVKIVKVYAPAFILGTMSLTSILASHHMMDKRNIALGAAFTTLNDSYKKYRKRVIEKYGETVDREMKHGIKAETHTEKVVDENGKESEVVKTDFVVKPSDISGYARFFEEYTKDNRTGETRRNRNWKKNNEYNIMFLKNTEQTLNDMLRSKGHVFLNEAYDLLDLPRTQEGQIVGWVYDLENPVGDNYVDLGLYADNLSYSDYVNGFDPAILLDFNVDGNIWELMK